MATVCFTNICGVLGMKLMMLAVHRVYAKLFYSNCCLFTNYIEQMKEKVLQILAKYMQTSHKKNMFLSLFFSVEEEYYA